MTTGRHNTNLLPGIAFMQTVGIILVVAGHAFFQRGDHIVCRWIYTFHMSLFFFLSGYTFMYSSVRHGISLSKLSVHFALGQLRGRALRLLVPYLVLSTLVFLPKVMLSRYSVRPVDASFSGYLHQLLYPYYNVIGSFWFLPTLFLVFALVLVLICIYATCNEKLSYVPGSGRSLVCAMMMALCVSLTVYYDYDTILNLRGVVHYTFYFLLGMACMHWRWLEWMRPHTTLWLGASLLLSIFLVVTERNYVTNWLHIIMGVNGIVMCASLSQLSCRYSANPLQHLYGATYTIYIYSWFVQAACIQLLTRVTSVPMPLACMLSVPLGIYLPWSLYRYLMPHTSVMSRLMKLVSGMR